MHLSRGVERGICYKTSYLGRIPGNEVYIITADMRGRKPSYTLGTNVSLINLGASDRFVLFYGKYRRRLRRCLEELRPDICVSVGGNEIYALADIDFGGKKIAEYHFSHEKFLMKYGRNFLGRKYAELRNRILKKAIAKYDAYVVLTRKDQQDWKESCPEVRQIYNPATFEEKRDAALDRRHVIAAGRLVEQKNYPDMLAAWEIVHRKHPDWVLDIYGEGKLRKRLAKEIGRRFPGGGVLLKGNCRKMNEAFLESSILVLSSHYEGFPMVLLEASACGVPMVSYDCPKGPSEIIEDGVNGILVRQYDVEGLAQGLCTLIEDDALRKRMGAKAKEMGARFPADGVMKQWVELFSELAG